MAPIKSPKARCAAECRTLEQLPNVGPAMAGDLRAIGIRLPTDLLGRDALTLYRSLERHSGKRQDPCVLDTFMAVVDFMQGATPLPWWAYTAQRKRLYGTLAGAGISGTSGTPLAPECTDSNDTTVSVGATCMTAAEPHATTQPPERRSAPPVAPALPRPAPQGL